MLLGVRRHLPSRRGSNGHRGRLCGRPHQSPSYEDVCSHTTGHAETVLDKFDLTKVAYRELLDVFWRSHDPTTLNRQGPDVGDQYRSAIFTFSDEQARAAKRSLTDEQAQLDKKITTEILPAPTFYKAEAYHQQYDEKTGRHSCPLPRRGKSDRARMGPTPSTDG